MMKGGLLGLFGYIYWYVGTLCKVCIFRRSTGHTGGSPGILAQLCYTPISWACLHTYCCFVVFDDLACYPLGDGRCDAVPDHAESGGIFDGSAVCERGAMAFGPAHESFAFQWAKPPELMGPARFGSEVIDRNEGRFAFMGARDQ